jgi:tripartite-type tricarboxylate transporter receptor subunit TctC
MLQTLLEEAPMATRSARLVATVFSGCTMAAGLSVCAHAQGDFPSRPVRLINPFAPGGSVDLVGRSVAIGLTEIWNQQVIVDNRPGAGTVIGTEIVARSEPDGYTMLCNSSAISIMPNMYRNMRFDTLKDLVPIIQVAESAPILAVHPSVPAKSVQELIALAKAQPGKITAAASGIGSTNHLTTEMFKSMAQVDLLIVPYKGGSPAIVDLIGGQVKMFFNSAAQFIPLSKAGKVRALATGGAKRADYAPEIPTVAESGVPGFEAATWFGIYGPRGLPKPIAQKWNDAVNRYVKTPQAQQTYRKQYQVLVGGTLEEFGAFHRSETARWGKVMKEAGIKPQIL